MVAPPRLVGTMRGPRRPIRVRLPPGHSQGRDIRAPKSRGRRGRARPADTPRLAPEPPGPPSREGITGAVKARRIGPEPMPVPAAARRVVAPKGSIAALNSKGRRSERDRVPGPAPGRSYPRHAASIGPKPLPSSGAYLEPPVWPRQAPVAQMRTAAPKHRRIIGLVGGTTFRATFSPTFY